MEILKDTEIEISEAKDKVLSMTSTFMIVLLEYCISFILCL